MFKIQSGEKLFEAICEELSVLQIVLKKICYFGISVLKFFVLCNYVLGNFINVMLVSHKLTLYHLFND